MKKTKSKKVNVRKQLKVKLENTLTRHKNIAGFKPTEQQLYHWFNVINRGLFNSRLPRVPLYLKKLHKDWGRCVANWDNCIASFQNGKTSSKHLLMKWYIYIK